jgi:hypothetical protein
MIEMSAAQIADAAEKELGAFLFVVNQEFGSDEVRRAADLWIQNFETADWIDAKMKQAFRQVTIQTSIQLAQEATASIS